MIIDTSRISVETRSVFELFSQIEGMSRFCLIGGTALALQAGHRNSLDLDFAVFGPDAKIPSFILDSALRSLKSSGHSVDLITSQEDISGFKINCGMNLLDYIRDYVVNGVKVQFFANQCSEELRQLYAASSDSTSGSTFSILSPKGLAISKSLVLTERVRSRDLFDVMWLVKNQYLTISGLLETVKRHAVNNDPELVKNRLTGVEPPDHLDEGLDPVGVSIAIDDIYAFFDKAISLYERDVALDRFQQQDPSPD